MISLPRSLERAWRPWRLGGSTRRSTEEAAFEQVREAIRRHLCVPGTDQPLEPYPEQLAGARALLRGAVAEMATGEGKTVTAAFAAAVWAREGPVHIATANAYLAARDAALLAPVYADLGLRTGVVTPELTGGERRNAYAADIVYSTLSELGFDYLRDRLVTRLEERVQVRGLGALLVDEADLLLIDEARTPLVIARPIPAEEGPDLRALARLVEELVVEQAGRVAAKLELLRGLPPHSFDAAVLAAQLRRGAPRDAGVLALFAERPAAAATAERTEQELRGAAMWMLDEGLLYGLDERARTAYFTGDGQALIEARLGPIFAEPETSGETLAALHNLIVAYALFQRDRDYLVREDRVVLIEEATGRAAESRRYMHGLHGAIEVKELGAPLEETETLAQISVQQFVRQYVRIAGMTGTAMPAAREFARVYGLDVVRIPRHRPNRRIDLPPRLYRTAAEVDAAVVAEITAAHALGRPVLTGTFDVARSERLSALFTRTGLPHAVLNAREHAREAEIVAGAGRAAAITIATNMAGRGTDIRLEGKLGLSVLATEAQVSRRLDDQLRGRSARQGDEGVTRLYTSLEDETLRFYGSPGLRAAALQMLARQPYLEGREAARVIEDAQERAERLHGGQRQQLFAFDQVIEAQRRAMLDSYERALRHPAPDALVRGFIPEVAAGELARRPSEDRQAALWFRDLVNRYGLPLRGDDGALAADALAAFLLDRFVRAQREAGGRWPALARAALLRAAAELWAFHVDSIDQLQRRAPSLYAFLPVPAEIPYAREASRRYSEYVWAVKAEALSALLTVPQPYERALPAETAPALSVAAQSLLAGGSELAGVMSSG